jgi:glycosyltransferase involved in cell wall biosynthesis
MKFSIIIPLHKKDNTFLRRCITSVQEQDFTDREIIVVGKDNEEAKKVCEESGVSYYEIESDNASAKRNHGFDKSKGEIVFFFDADCILLAGMLRLIKDAFEDNPDCSFVYSGYRWNVESLNVFPSRPFDPYLLQSANYISTMSPMKREVFCRFDENLEFFQDWDLFIRITKEGHKGFFLKDIVFITEPSDKQSISGKEGKAYLEKVTHIKHINNIPERPICVCTLGAPYQAIQRAKVLDADYIGSHQGTTLCQLPSMFENKYKMIYAMGFYPAALENHAKIFANAPKDCLKVIQWIGTDVYQLRNGFNWETIKYIRDKILKHIDVQLCNSEFLEGELGELGIKAHKVYMPLCEEIPEDMPLPEKFTVGIYYSDTNPMHNEDFLMDVAKSMPDIDFKFFGGSKQATEENIEYLPFVGIKDAIKMCSMNVRISVHDGFPHTPIHFLLGGRQVLTNFKMPCMEYIKLDMNREDYGKAKVELTEKIREIKKSPKQENIDRGRVYYKEIMDKEAYKKIIYTILDKGKDFIFKEESDGIGGNKEVND